jgi:hypothetical protein
MKKILVVILTIVLGFGGFLYYDWHTKTNAQGAEPSISQYSWTDARGTRHFSDTAPPEGATDIRKIKGHKYIAPPRVYAIKNKGADYYKKIKKQFSKLKKKEKRRE